ncbi:MAG: ScyD/ScyE family protein [Chloroflexota bacterium]|nr:ScyD/ScyE family protein [Chloroflexota bacterium]
MRRSLLLIVTLLTLLAAPVAAQEATPQASALTTIASGLISPRGFLWTAKGTLYVAQAGSGGASLGTPTAPPPVGPFQGGSTASVVRIENGCPVLVAGGLPSTSDQIGGILGVEDLAVLGGQLYAAVDGGGEAHGNAAQPSGVYRILENGSTELVADLSAWVRANPVAKIPPDFDPDAAGYGLVADETAGTLWVGNPNSGEILSVSLDGTVTRVADLSAGHLVPTMMVAAPQGGVYAGYLTPVPFPDGVAKVSHIAADGTVTDVWTGLTAVTDVAVSPDGTLYAVEMSTGNVEEPPFLVPGSGRIVRQTGPASAEDVASGLMFPITIRFGPDGALYVALPAMGTASGGGVIARIDGVGTPAATAAPPACTPAGGVVPAA